MSMEAARKIISEAAEGILDERPNPQMPEGKMAYQVWALRMEMQQYAFAMKALESK